MVLCTVTAPSTGDFSEPSHTPFHIFHYPQASDPSSHCQGHSLRLPPPTARPCTWAALYYGLWPTTPPELTWLKFKWSWHPIAWKRPQCLQNEARGLWSGTGEFGKHPPAGTQLQLGLPQASPHLTPSPPRLFPSSRDATCLHAQLFSPSWSRRGAFLSGSAKHLAVLKSLLKMNSSMPPNNDPLQMYSSWRIYNAVF